MGGAPSLIPAPLDELGAVFVPIDPREKGTTRPRTDEHLYGPDDPVLGAYLESGHNYGIACKGDLAVIDADEPEVLQEARAELDETASQVSGSRTSEHDFLYVPGLEEDIPLYLQAAMRFGRDGNGATVYVALMQSCGKTV
jgi:hypothetical protein